VHIVDTTLFFAPHSGGVKRYLLTKQRLLAAQSGVRHTIVVPGSGKGTINPGLVELSSPAIPFGSGYRIPIGLGTWSDALCALRPDVIEAGDPYHVAWAVLHSADRLGVPAVAFVHSDLSRLLGARFGKIVRAGVPDELSRRCANRRSRSMAQVPRATLPRAHFGKQTNTIVHERNLLSTR
jgi:alpha-1,6-mannosyltransferase